jgi:hypothetical protein
MDEGEVSSGNDSRLDRRSSRRIQDAAIGLRVSGEGDHCLKDGYLNDRCPARVNETIGSGSADGLEHAGIPLQDRISAGRLRLGVSCARGQVSRQNEN